MDKIENFWSLKVTFSKIEKSVGISIITDDRQKGKKISVQKFRIIFKSSLYNTYIIYIYAQIYKYISLQAPKRNFGERKCLIQIIIWRISFMIKSPHSLASVKARHTECGETIAWGPRKKIGKGR